MTIDVFSAAGQKIRSMELPSSLFGADVNWGLAHQALVRHQSNRRQNPAHVKTRAEVVGSTRKLYAQKHTGRARRGPVRSPLMRGGGKAFGPRNDKNYEKKMPKGMRHAALRSCLALQAKEATIIALESYGEDRKTKSFAALLAKLPIQQGRRTLIVVDAKSTALSLAARNIPSVTSVGASFLNPEGLLTAKNIVFLIEALTQVEQLFGRVIPPPRSNPLP